MQIIFFWGAVVSEYYDLSLLFIFWLLSDNVTGVLLQFLLTSTYYNIKKVLSWQNNKKKNVSEVEHVTECKSNGSVQKAFVELFYLLLTLFYIVFYFINKLFYVHEWTDGETEW